MKNCKSGFESLQLWILQQVFIDKLNTCRVFKHKTNFFFFFFSLHWCFLISFQIKLYTWTIWILKGVIVILTWIFFQFAGGFDAESMKAFEELRSRIHSQKGEDNKLETWGFFLFEFFPFYFYFFVVYFTWLRVEENIDHILYNDQSNSRHKIGEKKQQQKKSCKVIYKCSICLTLGIKNTLETMKLHANESINGKSSGWKPNNKSMKRLLCHHNGHWFLNLAPNAKKNWSLE